MRRPLIITVFLLSATLLLWAASEGPNSAVAGATSGGGTAWSNPGNITGSDDFRATAALVALAISQELQATTFGFSLPSGSVVGIEAAIERSKTVGSGVCEDNTVQLLIGGTATGDDNATAGAWPGSDATANYGGAADLWGLTPTAAQINATDFGFMVKSIDTDGSNTATCAVDHMTLTVTFTASSKVIITESRNAGRIEPVKGE